MTHNQNNLKKDAADMTVEEFAIYLMLLHDDLIFFYRGDVNRRQGHRKEDKDARQS